MRKEFFTWWAIASGVWVLVMASMTWNDLAYSVKYHVQRDRIEAAYQAEVAANEKEKQEGLEKIRLLLQAAKRYEELQFLTLATSPVAWRPGQGKGRGYAEPNPDYAAYQEELATLEKTYGKADLRKYRNQDQNVQRNLQEDLLASLPAPSIRQPQLAHILFHMFALPLTLLLALWIFDDGFQRLRARLRTQ
jgi:hypothetical protein